MNEGTLDRQGDRRVIRFERRLDHPVERVWRALTEPDEAVRWWGRIDAELEPGGRFDVTWLNTDEDGNPFTMHATITELDSPHLLETTGDAHGVLRWELRPDGDGTLLTFTSTLDLPDEYRDRTIAGWHYHLDALETALAGGEVELIDLPNDEFDRIAELYAGGA